MDMLGHLYYVFQSTLPTRGSDVRSIRDEITQEHFNPRSPRGGATGIVWIPCMRGEHFNPRSPRGGATKLINDLSDQICISIHAPHEGERRGGYAGRGQMGNFNPRSPRGGATSKMCWE